MFEAVSVTVQSLMMFDDDFNSFRGGPQESLARDTHRHTHTYTYNAAHTHTHTLTGKVSVFSTLF